MNLPRRLCSCLFVLLLAPCLAPPLASADEPSLAEWTRSRVDDGLLKPLAVIQSQNRRFSRARPVPHEHRVRVSQTTATRDGAGRAFMSFAIDVRFGPEWHENDIVGCAYRESGKIFVKRADGYRPAAFLLGKNEEVVAGVCEAPAGA